jgi:hypothetical protein
MGIARSSGMMRMLCGTSHSRPLVTKVRNFHSKPLRRSRWERRCVSFRRPLESWGDIKLLKNVCDCLEGRIVTWFWDFSVRPVIDPHPERTEDPPTILPARDMLFLLGGEVVQPISVK